MKLYFECADGSPSTLRFISEDVGISQNRTTITLSELNWSLGKALAAVYWYGEHIVWRCLAVLAARSHAFAMCDRENNELQQQARVE